MASSEKPIAQQNHPVLKCPRCDSSNTKFCYYNNYSLSQPRHYCKACKRYWTRGGTLRNVPVGGGCRKNKRIFTTLDYSPNPNPNSNPNLGHSTSLYGNPKYLRFNTGVSDIRGNDGSRYDLIQPQVNSLGLGFSSSDPLIIHNSSCNSDHIMMPSLNLASNLQQQPRFLGFAQYGAGSGSVVNEVQMEGPKRSNWNSSLNGQNDNNNNSQIFKALESSDPTSFLWTIIDGDGGEWHDPTASNISVSLI